MKNSRVHGKLMAILFGLLFIASCQQDEAIPNAELDERNTIVASFYTTSVNFYGLGLSNDLHLYKSRPFALLASTQIIGLRDGEILLAIDIRPSNKALYGISNMSALYEIRLTQSPFTAQAILLNAESFNPVLEGTLVGMDFHPSSNNIQVVTDTGQSLEVDPNTGMVVAVDPIVNSHGDPVALHSAAYLGNFGTTTGPVLYDLDVLEGKLYKLDPSTGIVTFVASTGFSVMGEGGFDINTKGTSLAVFQLTSGKGGVQVDPSTSIGYFVVNINLKTGYVTRVGAVQPLIGIAIQ